MGFNFIFMFIFWIIIIVLVVLLFQKLTDKDSSGKSNKPLDILKERYARGDINKKEYEEKRRELIK